MQLSTDKSMDCSCFQDVILSINKIMIIQNWFQYIRKLMLVNKQTNEPVTNDNDEKITTKNDVEYLRALAKCGNDSRVSRYRRIH